MKRILYAILVAIISVFYFNCQKELSYNGPLVPENNAEPVTATLQGNIVDENGAPAAGVTVTAGAKTALTDDKGYFRIRNASLDKLASLVTATKPGYFKAYRVFSASTAVNQVKVRLLKKIMTGSLNSTAGGTILLSNGSQVNFTANSFSKASGEVYSGAVNVYAAYIDPTSREIGETVPGSFLANDQDNKKVILTSYGMMAVELESTAGEKLQIASGHTAQLNFSIPSGLQASAPAKIALWYVDEKTGLWKEEGSATKSGNTYSGDVKHFTYWNCDVPGPTVNLSATFVNQNGQPLIYTDILIRPATGYASAHGYTDSLGQINGPVPANTNLTLEVMAPYPCYNVIYSQTIAPLSGTTQLGTITVNNTQSLFTIQGKLLNCSGAAVVHGYAQIEIGNMIRYVSTNSAGNFAITLTTCGLPQTVCTVIGVDSLAQQQGTPVMVAVTQPVTDAGNITACGTSTVEFVNYSVDGTPVNITSSVPGNSFSSSDTVGVTNQLVFIQGYRSLAERLALDFYSNGTAGIFPINYLAVGNYGLVTPVAPCNIIITNFAQQGEYFEGSFSGQFKDAQLVNHNLSGTLRVRRMR